MPPNNQPIAAVRLQIGHGSDPGRERAENQDCYGVAASRQSTTRVAPRGVWHVVEKRFLEERGQLFIVADGIGGHNAGELASELAVKSVLRDYYSLPFASPAASLQQAIIAAGQEVLARSESGDQALAGMGTTVTALVVRGNQAILAHVGDSRCYRINYEKIEQQTQDHTWVREQIQAGVLTEEEAQRHPYRHVLSRSLGRGDSAPDVLTWDLAPGDRMLLCSDGLSNLVAPQELYGLVMHHAPQPAVDQLLILANQRGGPDNITAVVVQVMAAGEPETAGAPAAGRSRGWMAAGALAVAAIACASLFVINGLTGIWTRPTPTPTRTRPPSVATENSVTMATSVLAAPLASIAPTITQTETPQGSPTVAEASPAVIGPTTLRPVIEPRKAIISVPGGVSTYLYPDPNNDATGIIELTQGTFVTIVGETVTGKPAYGDDQYYLVEVEQGTEKFTGYVVASLVRLRQP